MKKLRRFFALFLAAAASFAVFTASPAFAEEYSAAAEKTAGEILSSTDAQMSQLEKVLAVHDKLIDVCKYDYQGYQTGQYPDTDFTADGLLSKRVGVCQGYALAYEMLMSRLGVPVICVHSSTHMWNMVELDGEWYHVDCTFDDPLISGADISLCSHQYFLLSDSAMSALAASSSDADHSFWKKLWYLAPPTAGSTRFDSYASTENSIVLSTSSSGAKTAQDTSFWATATRAELDALEAASAASVWLDTASYTFAAGDRYVILAKSNLGESMTAASTNPSVVAVESLTSSSGQALIAIRGKSAGNATVTVTSASGAASSIPVTVTSDFVCDTSAVTISAGKTYQFRVTAKKTPVFQVAGVGTIPLAKQIGSDYFYKVTATSSAGVHGVYINGARSALCTFA